MISKNIAVIGDGGWGTTLAIHLAKKGYPVTLWGAFADYCNHVQKTRVNEKFLPGITLPNNINVTSELTDAIMNKSLIVFAVPSKYALNVLKQIQTIDFNRKKTIFLSVTKGFDPDSLCRMSEIIEKTIGSINLAVLSGPNIATEVVKGIPSTAVIASKKSNIAKKVQEIFNSSTFRVYTNTDIIGVELGGAVKNIIAIACGVCDGLGFGTNTKAAIVTRGIAEMARLGKAMGGKPKTFIGLSGLGDLVTTCFSPKSRNRTVGEQIGQGKSVKEILGNMEMVAEGVDSVKAIYHISEKLGVPMPITFEVYELIYKNKSPQQAVNDLMTRKMKAE